MKRSYSTQVERSNATQIQLNKKQIAFANRILISALEFNANTLTPIVAFLLVKKMKSLIQTCELSTADCGQNMQNVVKETSQKIQSYFKEVKNNLLFLV
jgi:hypothetical protein